MRIAHLSSLPQTNSVAKTYHSFKHLSIMDTFIVFLLSGLFIGGISAAPKMRVYPQLERKPLVTQNLPANWTEIREEISDNFSCDGKSYGYYADVDNDCQVFHVCLPVQGRNFTFKWSFICPTETIFNQESFTCTRSQDSIRCEDAPDFYKLNDNFGATGEEIEEETEKDEEKKEGNEAEEQPNSVAATDARQGKAGSDQPYGKRRNRTG